MLIYLQMISTEEDRSKFETIYHAYKGLMFHVAMEILHHTQDAEDAVHQAFVKIAENIQSIEPTSGPRTKGLVVLITEQRALDLLRRRNRVISLEEEEWAKFTIEYESDNTLTKCINDLPSKYRSVIMLKYHYGFTSDEIAAFLGLTRDNVMKIHQRAKVKLEQMCVKEGLL